MTAAIHIECLDDETLAAFVDGVLTETDRVVVTAHLASCGECRSKAADGWNIVRAEGNVAELHGAKNRWWWIGGAIAAAVVVVLVLIAPLRNSVFDEPGIPKLVQASRELKARKTYGRLSGGFPYRPTSVLRSGEAPSAIGDETLPLYRYAGEILNGDDLHARGVLALLLDKRAEAIPALRKALANDPANPAIAQDLAVALLQNGDYVEALEISDRLSATGKTPEIIWNRAYTLQHMGKYREAVAAWNEYLKLDSTSRWAQEAIRQRDTLQDLLTPTDRQP